MEVLGIDVGGTGIKGALVESGSGELLTERYRVLTPQPSTPKKVIATVGHVVSHLNWQGPIGCGFPAAVRHGIVCTAANISKKWLGVNAEQALQEATGCTATVINDADAAGLAEMRFGAGRGQDGVVLLVTLGTGIGTAIFIDGRLLPNTELGHIELDGQDAELTAAEIVRKQKELSWKQWARGLDRYLTTMEKLLWPDLIIIGGGASKKHDQYAPFLTLKTPVVPAQMRNEAGIVGAAVAAALRNQVLGKNPVS